MKVLCQLVQLATETAGSYSEGIKNKKSRYWSYVTEEKKDQRETFWFIQILKLAAHRGNAVSLLCGERERQRYFGS